MISFIKIVQLKHLPKDNDLMMCTIHFNASLILFADIDECALGDIDCEHMCTNTNGSYACLCESGYSLAVNGFSCISKKCMQLAMK